MIRRVFAVLDENPLARHLIAARRDRTWGQLSAEIGIAERELVSLAMGYFPPHLSTLLRMDAAFQWSAAELGEVIMELDIGTPSEVLFGESARSRTAAVPAAKRVDAGAGRRGDEGLAEGVLPGLQGQGAGASHAPPDRRVPGVGLRDGGDDGAVPGGER